MLRRPGTSPLTYRQPGQIRFLGLDVAHFLILAAASLTGSALVLLLLNLFHIWTVLAYAVCLFIFVHLCLFSDHYVAFPGLISFIAAVELLLAPTLATSFPPSFHVYDMVLPLGSYLQYAIPATIALWIGLHWPVTRNLGTQMQWPQPSALSPRLRWAMDVMLIGGIALDTFIGSFPSSLFFLVTIVSSFRFFAALVWMITRTPGWTLRVTVVIAQLIVITSSYGIFYTLLQWTGFFVLMYGFRLRWRAKLALVLTLALMSTVMLQYVKADYRAYLRTENPDFVERISTLGRIALDQITGQNEQQVPVPFGDVLVRFNQGWIVSRIIDRVPRKVPYAGGDTIKDALIFSLLPRALFPNKPEGASRVLFARFTGLQLNSSTSMGLSVIGEMYANFGSWGGVLGTFVFGSLVGLAYARFVKLARKSPHWWAAAPIVLLAAIEPAWNLGDISNYIIKSALVLITLAFTIPTLRELLALEPIWRRKKVPTAVAVPRGRPSFDFRRAQ